jgi:hypothetical protein
MIPQGLPIVVYVVSCTTHDKAISFDSPSISSSIGDSGGKTEQKRQEKPREDQDKVISTYSTKLKSFGKEKNRYLNVKRTNIDITIKPNEIFSFNKYVGPRTTENGYLEAPLIFLGEMTSGIGGGVCQVSSTLYAVSRFAGLEIVERRSHSRPSKYIEKGLDATVNFPKECNGHEDKNCQAVDLKIKNQYDFPVTIKSYLSDDEEAILKISVFGSGNHPTVSYMFGMSTNGLYVKTYRKTGKFLGKYKKKIQSGSDGLIVTSIFTQKWADGKNNKITSVSNYEPVNEIWEVGLGWDGPPPWEIE